MTIWNLGSINADFVYSVPHIPAPGETLASIRRSVYLGGKGANMSVAAARAGAHVRHIGAVGADGAWARDRLTEYGVDTRDIASVETETAQAIIAVDSTGENTIILHPGANHAIPEDLLAQALSQARTGDWFVTQNETTLQQEGAALARSMGLHVAYAAAPFSAPQTEAILPQTDLLILNAVEAAQLSDALQRPLTDLPPAHIIVTRGSEGSDWIDTVAGKTRRTAAIPVTPVDTTGAGDTFTGYLLASLDRGEPMEQALGMATRAGALMVTRHGTADAIPDLAEVRAFAEARR